MSSSHFSFYLDIRKIEKQIQTRLQVIFIYLIYIYRCKEVYVY